VFVGIPVAAHTSPSGGLFDGPQRIHDFKVLWAFKGSREIPQLATDESSAACGLPFLTGMPYFVYAYASNDFLATNTCSRTTPLPLAGSDFVSALFGLDVGTGEFYAAVAVLLTILVVWRRRMRRQRLLNEGA